MRHTRAHTKNRRSHHKAEAQKTVVDKETQVPHLRHRVCLETGRYKGNKVIDIVSDIEKKTKKS